MLSIYCATDGEKTLPSVPQPNEILNHSLSFDGADDYVDIPDSESLNFGASSITYSCWFKKSGNTHYLQTNL